MPSNDEKKVREARANARRLIEQAPKVLMGLFAMSGVAYLSGSVYTRSYFAEFGASWILEEVPTVIYFGQSWIPLLLILFFGYLATTNLALIESQDNLTESTRFKVSVAVVQYGPWLFIGLFAITLLLSTFDYLTAAIVLSIVSIVGMLLLVSSAFELLAVRFWKVDRNMDLSMAYIACVVVAAGLYFVPAQLGMNWGRADKQASSTLLTVYLPEDKEQEHKLLFSVGERLYVFPTRYQGKFPPVKTTTVAHVRFVPLEHPSN
jgi:hypothetical protein